MAVVGSWFFVLANRLINRPEGATEREGYGTNAQNASDCEGIPLAAGRRVVGALGARKFVDKPGSTHDGKHNGGKRKSE